MTMKQVKKMQIEIAPRQRMAETGSSLLRSIQNNEMPLMDLLVREAVQNSLDAALDGEGHIQVDFSIRHFNPAKLAEHFDGIRDRLKELYNRNSYRLLEIRDTNTTGLTGPLQEADLKSSSYGNLIKLVYHIGMPQKKEGAGGSWGLGKTVYYRAGIGLVIYYSRVFENGKYQSRLAACLVEDEESDRTLLANMGNHRGIAWWGRKLADGHSTIPLTDEEEILKILSALGAKPFEYGQTGTSVIIPFLKDNLRPVQWGTDFDGIAGSTASPWWTYDDSDYIKIALQKWYAPRLMNEKYRHGRWLRATVNGEVLTYGKFLPAFRIVQKLYNSIPATSGREGEMNDVDLQASIHVSQINLRNVLADGSVAGWMAFGRFPESDLKMLPPDNNPSPFVQIYGREFNGDSNPPIICFTRKPGMIVGYESSGKWTDGISRTAKNEFIIGIFVANSSNRLKDGYQKEGSGDYPLEEYIRGCEKADHASWQDWAPNGRRNPLIIERIQRQVAKNIESRYRSIPESAPPAKHAILGRMLARAILPPEGFGRLGIVQKTDKGGRQASGIPRGTAPVLSQVTPPVYDNGLAKISFKLYSGKMSNLLELKLGAAAEGGNIDAFTWEQADRGTGTPFPAKIIRFELTSADKGEPVRAVWNVLDGPTVAGKTLLEEPLRAPISREAVGIRLLGEKNRTYKGTIWIKPEDPMIRLHLSIEPIPEEDMA